MTYESATPLRRERRTATRPSTAPGRGGGGLRALIPPPWPRPPDNHRQEWAGASRGSAVWPDRPQVPCPHARCIHTRRDRAPYQRRHLPPTCAAAGYGGDQQPGRPHDRTTANRPAPSCLHSPWARASSGGLNPRRPAAPAPQIVSVHLPVPSRVVRGVQEPVSRGQGGDLGSCCHAPWRERPTLHKHLLVGIVGCRCSRARCPAEPPPPTNAYTIHSSTHHLPPGTCTGHARGRGEKRSL